MRLDPKLVHPSLFKATDAVMWGTGMTTENQGDYSRYHSAWFKEYGAGCLGWCAGIGATFVASLVALKAMHAEKPVVLFTMLAFVGLSLVLGGVATMRHARRLSTTQLESLLPLLKLSETGRAYAETIVALYRSGRPKAEVEESIGALNALLDEEARLVETRTRLAGTETRDERQILQAERERMEAKIADTHDPSVRETLEQSLSLVEERQRLFEFQGSHLERIDAHLELLRQAILSTRDASRRLASAPSAAVTDFATDGLRAAVARAREQSQETERALAELRTI